MSLHLDGDDLTWKNAGELSAEHAVSHVIPWDDRGPTFWERLKMAWQFLWKGRMDWPNRLIAFWEYEKKVMDNEANFISS
jgi:hypothetical protein